MKIAFKDFAKTMVCISAILYWVNHEWLITKDLLVNNHIVSFSEEGITIILFAKVIWYIGGVLALSAVTFFYLGLKSIFNTYRYGLWPYFFGWLTVLLMIVFALAKPVPWYGLAPGLFSIFFLFWVLFRTIFPPDFKQAKT